MTHLPHSSLYALILDMDGVLWRGTQPLGDLPALFRLMERKNLRVVLATNNATLSVMDYQKKIRGFGVVLEDWQIVNSAQAVAHFLVRRFPGGGRVNVLGEAGLIRTLAEQGFQNAEHDVVAVVAGLDRYLTYDKLTQAALLIRDGALFIGTNPDRTYPMPGGRLVPGAGAVLAALEASTDVAPIIIGKPAPEMYQVAMERLGSQPEETLVVGDRLETDIAGAQALGCHTALVLSGVTTEAAAVAWEPAPDWIEANLTELLDRL
jgi:4-nitrophenyl phosphatase